MTPKYIYKPPIEVVLENGSLAKIRRPTRGDFIASFGVYPNNTLMAMAVLVTRMTTVDDHPLTIEQWLEADFEITEPIATAINKIFGDAKKNQNKGGVA